MKKSNELLGRYGDLKYDIELAICKLIKKDGKKHVECVYIKEFNDSCFVDIRVGEKDGNRAIIAKCDRWDGMRSIEEEIKNLDIESAFNILTALEDASEVED